MTIKEIDEALEEGSSLKQIAQSYTEIANLKIKKIRSEVERNRVFFEEISKVYALIKKLASEKKVNIQKPKKTISLIITSNYRFYGSINSDLIDFFIKTTQKIKTDRVLLGKAAVDFFRADPRLRGDDKSSYQEVLLKTDQPTQEELLQLVDMIKDYNQVLIFYSSMKSLMTQEPTMTDLTASDSDTSTLDSSSTRENEKRENEFKFILEPELSKILHFFDSQIITLLLEGTFLESELSRTASRFISMDTAETEANKFISEYEKLKAFSQRSADNNVILENFASMAVLRKEDN